MSFDDGNFRYFPLTATTCRLDGFSSISHTAPYIVTATATDPSFNVYNIVEIDDFAFIYDISIVTSFDLSASIYLSTIGTSTFQGCISLTGITFPNSLTTIGTDTFFNCTSLTSINFPNSLTSIGTNTFYNCTNLTSINFPNSLTSIGTQTFNNCNSLTSINLPSSLTSIGLETFQFCTSLTSINLSNSTLLTSIGENIFYNCINLTSIVLPSSLTSIGTYTFNSCTSLTSITLPNSLTSIGTSTFLNCTSLTSITLPNSLTTIGTSTFLNCTSLTVIVLPNSLTSIGDGTFYDCTNLTSINFPNLLTSIGTQSFYGCISLTSINLPNSLTSIGTESFYGCTDLTSITFPSSLTSLGTQSFFGCISLSNVYFLGPFQLTFSLMAFPTFVSNSQMFYNQNYPNYSLYTFSFQTLIPFQLINSFSYLEENTQTTIFFPPIIASQYNTPITYTIIDSQTQIVYDTFTEVNTTHYTFTGLMPYTSYSFYMRVFLNVEGPLIQTILISFTTQTDLFFFVSPYDFVDVKKCFCVKNNITKKGILLNNSYPNISGQQNVSNLIHSQKGGIISYGNVFYSGGVQPLNYLGRLEGQQGGSGQPPRNKF